MLRIPSRRRLTLAGILAALMAALLSPAAMAQDAEKKLQTIKRELKSVAAERRELEGRRGAATRQLREADEQVGRSSRSLRETEQQLAKIEQTLAQLQPKRDELHASLGARREELARLLRSAYTQGRAAPLKLLLAQDRVADASRLLTYHRYVQRDRSARIATLNHELGKLDRLEREILAQRSALAEARQEERAQLAQLERDRKARAALVAKIDGSYQDKRKREQALGRDAKGLEQVLKKLRAAAARAEKQRKAAAAKKAREIAAAASAGNPAPRGRSVLPVPNAAAPQVGGLGWPLTGSLLAGYGGKMPDGRGSDGLLIAADAGTPVKVIADGTVVYAEWMTGYGLLLIVDHGNDHMSLYAHNDALLREAGDRVKRGDAVSTVGSSGGHGRPALYFELRRDGRTINPGGWLKR
ncbi:MAG: peptidoglycan DD-metalloendopeptidase family protein [Pseudomonadota bacterium]|nr:peptidoglycan DD-metalloendopeptidase family protein [Pseudomonadota bacterium]